MTLPHIWCAVAASAPEKAGRLLLIEQFNTGKE